MTAVAALTVPAVIVNVAEVAPAATVTFAGILTALAFELASVTVAPPEGAAAVSVTVPVPDCPLVIVPLLVVKPLSAAAGGLIVTPNVSFAPLNIAAKVTGVGLVTGPAPTVKVPELEPCGIVRLDGKLAPAGDELRATAAALGAL